MVSHAKHGERPRMIEAARPGRRPPMLDQAQRGYHIVYRSEQANYCPGCGGRQWLVGRVAAECAVCATAIPLAAVSLLPRHAPIFIHRFGRDYTPMAA